MRRPVKLAGLVLGLALTMLTVGALAGGVRNTAPPVQAARGPAAQPAQIIRTADAAASIVSLQNRLKKLPDDWSAWASLGALYTAQARLTADSSYYGKADGAFATSLKVRPESNPAALTGKAALAASRHDFGAAFALTKQAQRLAPYSSTNLGVMVDALIELGRYPQAFTTLQRMVDLKPGVASFTRVSYSYELRGDTDGARYALERALEVAQSPADKAFALQYLGELAFNAGDLGTAWRQFSLGLRQDPGYVPLLAGRARVQAARGETARAIRDWQVVTTRLPQPSYLIEYAELLASVGRRPEAQVQYSLVDATAKLFRAAGANVDVELALSDADRGRTAEALSATKTQIDLRRSTTVQDAHAWALHAAGRDREALSHAKAANHLGMKSALFAYHRGEIEKALGHDKEAIRWLRRSLDINPYFSPLLAPRAQAALATLESGS